MAYHIGGFLLSTFLGYSTEPHSQLALAPVRTNTDKRLEGALDPSRYPHFLARECFLELEEAIEDKVSSLKC